MIIRYALALLCATSLLSADAQRRASVGIQLEAYLRTADPQGTVDLFVQGESSAVTRAVLGHHGRVKQVVTGWVNATVPVAEVEALAKEPAVQGFQFSLSKGVALNDSAATKARIIPVREGQAPLPAGYTGKGVLVGIIDTGLDLLHPDFQDSLGNTRVLHYWDQTLAVDPELTPQPYGYGQAWDSTAINAGLCTAVDPYHYFGHGTGVAGAAAGNGRATGHYTGAAPDADLIIVTSDQQHPNWKATIVDAVQYIIQLADQLERPVVINLSLGDYYGSHDGLDPAALFIDDLLQEAPGRMLVCAGGNSGQYPAYHLRTDVGADTSFTWFRLKPNSALGMDAVYFDLWADTADFSQVHFSVGADRSTGGPLHRGQLPFRTIANNLDQVVTDTLKSFSGNRLAVVHTYAERRGGQYHMEVFLPLPDSADAYRYRFSTTGAGRFDVWSSFYLGTSEIVSTIPSAGQFPDIVDYVLPDNTMSIVDSWACSPHVITVGNYQNEHDYIDYNGNYQTFPATEGLISASSSRGPSRLGDQKPDVSAPGDLTFSASTLQFIDSLLFYGQAEKVAPGGFHTRGGGTSVASPVVAGIVALYFEKCPRATAAEILAAINSTAYTDALTGAVPNIRYGNGKVDAFAALNTSHVPAAIEGPAGVCEGDTVTLSGTDFMYAYHWSNGASGLHIPFTGGDISLIVENGSGCLGYSDTLFLPALPLPDASIVADGVDLTASPGAAHQWYFEGEEIAGATGQMHQAAQNGYYQVLVTGANQCTALSDSLLVLSVGMTDADAAPARVWPVPADDRLTLVLPQGTTERSYLVLDAAGRIVLQGALRADATNTVDVSALASGVYVLRSSDAGQSWSLRFVKR
ncbi:MAG TPA: S8 family peptidase [Flavobacteriales bacterium]